MSKHIQLVARVPLEHSGSRFDQVAADLFPDYSRSRIQSWIREGELRLDGKQAKPNAKVGGGEVLKLDTQIQSDDAWLAQEMDLEVVYEDDEVLVLNKPSGLVVHPAAGNWNSTLLNGLIFHYPELREVPRAGIVHRLDKDTSGLMVVARSISAQTQLVAQLQARSVKRVYHAIARGELTSEGEVAMPIGRHPIQRTKMAALKHGGKPALTRYWPLEIFEGFTHLRLQLETGRTHQIRVHMAEIGFPLAGDPVYGRSFTRRELNEHERLAVIADFPRQALHAKQLAFTHPQTGARLEFQTGLPADFAELLHMLQHEF